MPENILEFLWFIGVVIYDALTCLRVKLSRCVPDGNILFGGCVTMTFLGVQMKQFWSVHILDGT